MPAVEVTFVPNEKHSVANERLARGETAYGLRGSLAGREIVCGYEVGIRLSHSRTRTVRRCITGARCGPRRETGYRHRGANITEDDRVRPGAP